MHMLLILSRTTMDTKIVQTRAIGLQPAYLQIVGGPLDFVLKVMLGSMFMFCAVQQGIAVLTVQQWPIIISDAVHCQHTFQYTFLLSATLVAYVYVQLCSISIVRVTSHKFKHLRFGSLQKTFGQPCIYTLVTKRLS